MLSDTPGIIDLVKTDPPPPFFLMKGNPTSVSILCCGCGDYIGMEVLKTLITVINLTSCK